MHVQCKSEKTRGTAWEQSYRTLGGPCKLPLPTQAVKYHVRAFTRCRGWLYSEALSTMTSPNV